MADEDSTVVSATPEASSPAPQDSAPSPAPASEPTQETSGTESKETLLDAVLKVIPASTEKDVLADQDAAQPEAPETADAEAPDEDDDKEPAAEASNGILRKKISKLLKSRHEFKTRVAELEARLPEAEIGRAVQAAAMENNLGADEIANLITIGGFMKRGEYKAFYDAAAPFMRKAQEYLGYALPADVRQKVQQGQMTEAAAKDYVRLSMDKQRGDLTRETEQTVWARQAHAQAQSYVEQQVSAYETRLAAADPEYKLKAVAIQRAAKAKLLDRGNTINSAEEALAITKEAYDEVNADYRKWQPRPQATARTPNGNGSTHMARAEPRSVMEAALQGLERSRNGAGL
jgi:hypothetical protein